MDVKITDNAESVMNAFHSAMDRALEEIGLTAEKYAVMKTPTDTGRLKNGITHAVQDDAVYIGTNVEYGVYVEYGTGKFASNGKGRPGWWVYVSDPNGGGKRQTRGERKIYTEAEARRIMAILRAKGLDAHMTQGIKPHHMIRDAAADHTEQYKRILQRAMEG